MTRKPILPDFRDSGNAGLRSNTGATHDGAPLALNRAPNPRIEPWVGRSMVAFASQAATQPLEGLLFNDTAYLRCAVGVDWTAGTADGPKSARDATFISGQHSKAMSIVYTGGIKVVGLKLRPGALRVLFGLDDGSMLDRMVSLEHGGVPDSEVTGLYNLELEPVQWLDALENWLATYIEENGILPPDAVAQAIELQSFVDPNCEMSVLADRIGVSSRTVERAARRDFGLTPKQIMRRARVLDMAAQLCGVADEEEEEIMLRFFDQAHQIREFQAFMGMTPTEFQERRSMLLTLCLEVRQARRLELLDRIKPDAIRPWMRRTNLTPV